MPRRATARAVVSTPETLHGQYRIDGTRISVSLILDNLVEGHTVADLVQSYPTLEASAVYAALAFAAEVVRALPPAHRIRATAAQVEGGRLEVSLEDGRVIALPLDWYPRLDSATPAQRANLRLIGGGVGIHWPDLDHDLSMPALLAHCCGSSATRR